MYSSVRYRKDLKGSLKPVLQSMKAFAKARPLAKPFDALGPCCIMCARLVWFAFLFAFYSARRIHAKF